MPTDRRHLSASVEDDTLDAWHAYCRTAGVSISALVEAMGRALPPAGPDVGWLRQRVAEARQIMVDRQDRRER